MRQRSFFSRLTFVAVLVGAQILAASGQGVKRLIVIKADGVPSYYVDEFVKKRDPATGRSVLPWFEEIFYKNGTRVPNFYSRGMSLSGPAWGQLDTGQHLHIKGNVEYDRYTLHPYDYLAIIPYYISYAGKRRVDTPAVEVLDELHIPLLSDLFPYERRYTANQLYQRGINWGVLAGGFLKLFPHDPRDLIDEWTMGIDYRSTTIDQNERDIIGKLMKRPEVDYYDYYDGSFDHMSHQNSDTPSRVATLKRFDRTLGRIWTAAQASSRADETAMILISDHGFNSEPGVYSQGFNLVRLLGSAPGGGHHVVTKRRLMLDYSIKGINPFVPLITTASKESYYLQEQADNYPTALLDFDGNERASIHLRENRLNILHILLQRLQRSDLSVDMRRAVTDAFFDTIDQRRTKWDETARQLTEELEALHRQNAKRDAAIASLPKKYTPQEDSQGLDKQAVRLKSLAAIGHANMIDYRKYLGKLLKLLSLRREGFDPSRLAIADVIAPRAIGDQNSVYDLQNYTVGPAQNGLTLNAAGRLDLDKSLARINYLDLLSRQTVRNNLQAKLSHHPVDFIAVKIDHTSLPPGSDTGQDAIWLYGGVDKQALILTRIDANGGRSFRYVPVTGLRQDKDGKVAFQIRDAVPGLPLKIIEDPDFAVPVSDRQTWLGSWHTEVEWLQAMHRCVYSNAILGLNEQLLRHDLPDASDVSGFSADDQIIRRFRLRQRRLTETDMLIVANNHWNFDVRGFNPGGNHGSFFRVSTNSVFMLAGGAKTGIPKGLSVDEPYDSLSVVPTILALMGKIDDENRPNAEMYKLGFRKFPGRVVREVLAK